MARRQRQMCIRDRNEECDLLAKEAAMSSDLKIDEIFELKELE